MNRRQIRDELANYLIGLLNGSDHEELCAMVGLDAGATSVTMDARLGAAVVEMQGVLHASMARAARR